jgi:hypothetical protein
MTDPNQPAGPPSQPDPSNPSAYGPPASPYDAQASGGQAPPPPPPPPYQSQGQYPAQGGYPPQGGYPAQGGYAPDPYAPQGGYAPQDPYAAGGYPGAPQYPGGQYPAPPAQQPPKRGLAIAALIVAVVALPPSWIPLISLFVGAPLAGVGLILAIIALVMSLKSNGGKGLSIAALIVSVVAIIGVVVTTVFLGAAINSASDDSSSKSRSRSSQSSSLSESPTDRSSSASTDEPPTDGSLYSLTTDEILADYLDVEIGAFTVEDEESGWPDTSLTVKLTNKSSKKFSAMITIEALDSSGDTITEDTIFTDVLNPGQTEEDDSSFYWVLEEEITPLKTATFKVTEVLLY